MCVHILGLLKHFRAHTWIAVTQRKLKGFAKGESLRLLRKKINNLFQRYYRGEPYKFQNTRAFSLGATRAER